MFGFTTNRSEKTTANSSRYTGLNIIGEGTTITGNINTSSDIRIDGRLEGDLICSAKVIVGSSGRIEGDINSHQVVVEGEVVGKIFAEDLVSLLDSARVAGTIQTQRMSTGAGCVIDGICTVTGVTSVAAESAKDASVINLEQQRLSGVSVAG